MFFIASFFGGLFSIGLIIKKSTEKKTPEFLANEKLEMKKSVDSLKGKLQDWKDYSLNDITNNLEYKYLRWITSKLSGTIKATDGNKIIAFERRQRGNYIDCRICASSTDFDYFIEYKNNITTIEFNGEYLGKIENEKIIYNASNSKVASLDRHSDENKFFIHFENGVSVQINRSFDNKIFINNPQFASWHPRRIRMRQVIAREPYQPYVMMNEINTFDDYTKQWIIALVLKETIYNSFSFVT